MCQIITNHICQNIITFIKSQRVTYSVGNKPTLWRRESVEKRLQHRKENHYAGISSTSFPGSFISPLQGPLFRLVTCLADKFIFIGGFPIYQSIVAAAVCYLQNRVSGQPWKALFQFRSEDLSYQVHCFQHLKLNWVWKL